MHLLKPSVETEAICRDQPLGPSVESETLTQRSTVDEGHSILAPPGASAWPNDPFPDVFIHGQLCLGQSWALSCSARLNSERGPFRVAILGSRRLGSSVRVRPVCL